MSTRQGKDTLGILHDNPGNIRFVEGVYWRGMMQEPNDGFCQFIEPIYGIRAMERALLTMYHEENLKTIQQIITRWAPPIENNTQAYINAVAAQTMYLPTGQLRMPDNLFPLCKAIIQHENGQQPYPHILFEDAYYLLKQEKLTYE